MPKPKTIVLEPSAKHTATIIILHGLGDTGAGWQLRSSLPHVKFVFPTAELRPITVNKGALSTAWYDILPFNRINPNEDEEGLLQAQELVAQIIRKEVEENKTPANRIILGGFSQGSALSILTGLTFEYPLAGIAALSGYVPLYKTLMGMTSKANRKTPIFWGHGTFDPVVKFDVGEDSAAFLRGYKYSVDFHSYPKMGHSVCPDEINDLLEFFKKTVPENPENALSQEIPQAKL
ncbi:hypothetical protein BGZ79_001966 [Entomortierella chlamydospora]|nr:hypothetical protein BGZ79_001966 [Entomortierella chlamydospora]